ncbi:glycosyltransferase family 4 protein [Mesobacillus foraminis]|uniref:glycosyltransferase family 4 protein n=1 Tax=Mesobacillus foraminis TaxID=279826 RepID=UPI001BEB3298|nr:glycosyltransferase family 4 protein [Mesobacillus foraminis]MBT2758421.1 glycosyltransferase family 4 protein [Mesobacillus foraminis]
MHKKILFCATVDYHFKLFHLPFMEWLKEHGWEIHLAANGDMDLPFVDEKYNLPIARSPFKTRNLEAYNLLKKIIDDNDFSIIDCHTPVGGVLARMAARDARKKGTKIIYTAHGFHFCSGAPLINWFIYYPIEKWLARLTDCLITINEEDYRLANEHHFKAGRIEQIHGVGVDTERFKPVDIKRKQMFREAYGYNSDDFILFYAAEFNKNKNQRLLIEVLSLIKKDVPEAKLILAGEGKFLDDCRKLAKDVGVETMIDFLGYRGDIDNLLKLADVAVATSKREGLPVNILEAMATGLPVIATDNRGHRELIVNDKNGWIIEDGNAYQFANKIKLISKENHLKTLLGTNGRQLILKKYSTSKILEVKSSLYKSYIVEGEDAVWAIP